jgi:hypothetical protein
MAAETYVSVWSVSWTELARRCIVELYALSSANVPVTRKELGGQQGGVAPMCVSLIAATLQCVHSAERCGWESGTVGGCFAVRINRCQSLSCSVCRSRCTSQPPPCAHTHTHTHTNTHPAPPPSTQMPCLLCNAVVTRSRVIDPQMGRAQRDDSCDAEHGRARGGADAQQSDVFLMSQTGTPTHTLHHHTPPTTPAHTPAMWQPWVGVSSAEGWLQTTLASSVARARHSPCWWW